MDNDAKKAYIASLEQESDELTSRIKKLDAFIDKVKSGQPIELLCPLRLLEVQRESMITYFHVLVERMAVAKYS